MSDLILEFDDGIAEQYLKREYNRRHPREVYWTMKSGKKINIKDMTDEHLLKAIRLIQRYEEQYDEYLEAMGGYPE